MTRRKCIKPIPGQWDAMEMTFQCFSIRTNLIENELQSVWECGTRRRDQEQVAAHRAKWRSADRQGDPCRRRTAQQKMFVRAPPATSSGTGLALEAIAFARRSSIKVGSTRIRAIMAIHW
jgi:hypothetical protein